jgi:hypothetical protein
MTLNRLVALLTPLVFAPAAGWAASVIARYAPGIDVSQDDIQKVFIAGALIALAPAAQWLHGWQKHEARQFAAETAVETGLATGGDAPTVAAPPDSTGVPAGLDGGDGSGGDFDALAELDEFGEDDLEDDDLDALLADDGELATIES